MSMRQRLKEQYFIRSHQVFSAANKILGIEFMANLWKKSHRQVYRWGADDDFCEETCKNPLDLLRITLSRLREVGREDVVEGAARLLFGPLGYEVWQRDICSDAGSVFAELLGLNKKVGELASTYEEVRADGEVTQEEQLAVDIQIDRIVEQALRFKDAARKESRATARGGHGGMD